MRWFGLPYLEQFIEEGAVMYHRLAEFLGVGFAAFIAHRNGLRRPVMVHHGRVIDRDIGSTVLKITHRVAALLHQIANQLVRFGNNAFWVIDEAALQYIPCLIEPCGFGRRQRCDIETLNAFLARLEFRLGL